MPFDVRITQVPDQRLPSLLTKLSADGYEPIVTAVGPGSEHVLAADLPSDWRPVRELEDQSYAWPKGPEPYRRYRVFAAETRREGTVHIAIGEAERAEAWGRLRKYAIAFLTAGAPQVPLVEFLEVDDYDSTHELLAVIRGSDGGKKMYGPGDTLPDVYARNFRTELYCDRVRYPRSWNKLAVIAHEDDDDMILNHALVQARRRGDV